MKLRSLLFFVVAVAVSLLGASHRFHDSAHAIGLITTAGGKVRHPVVLKGGRDSYTLIATATVLPPYRGDARIVLRGSPRMDYAIYSADPVIDLRVGRHPVFRNNILYGLKPGDRLALWLVMKIAPGTITEADSGVGKPTGAPMSAGNECCDSFHPSGNDPAKVRDRTHCAESDLVLAFYDTKSNRPVLEIPIDLKQPER